MTVWLTTGAFIGLVPLVLGGYFVLQQAYKIIVYRPVPATILDWGDRGHEGFRLKARYEYVVGNRKIISTHAFTTPKWGGDDAFGDFGATNEVQWDRRYRPGDQVLAFYNPTNHDSAFVLRDDLFGCCAYLYFGWAVLTVVVAFGMFDAAQVSRRKAMFRMAIVWHGIGAAAVFAYLTISDRWYLGTFVGETLVYELLGLIPLRYGLTNDYTPNE
jgi:hypothetical protein